MVARSARTPGRARLHMRRCRLSVRSRIQAGPSAVEEESPITRLIQTAQATVLAAGVASLLFAQGATAAQQMRVQGNRLPPPSADASRCKVEALDLFAETRAMYSQEAGSGAMEEAIVDIRGCDFSGLDLTTKVFSGVLMEGANLDRSRLVGVEAARVNARSAKLVSVDFTDANCYQAIFDGADLRDANFENSILTGASFGKDRTGQWANLEGTKFEGALISSSDVGRICANPTLLKETKQFELGCPRSSY